MADQNKLHIRLHVYDEEIEVIINREDEEFYRKAAKLITERYRKSVRIMILPPTIMFLPA